VALAASSTFALWLDPQEPDNYLVLTYWLQGAYVAYACVLAAVMWNRDSRGSLPLASHVADIAMASVFQYVTLGPESPFFTYYTFCLFAAALRWGWPATVRTTAVVLAAYLAMGASMIRAIGLAQFPTNGSSPGRCIRQASIALVSPPPEAPPALRSGGWRAGRSPPPGTGPSCAEGPERQASWGVAGDARLERRDALDARRVVAARGGRHHQTRTDEFAGRAPALEECTFFRPPPVDGRAVDRDLRGHAVPVERRPGSCRLAARGRDSVPRRSGRTPAGRVLFGSAVPSADIMPLAEVVGCEIGASLDQLHSHDRRGAWRSPRIDPSRPICMTACCSRSRRLEPQSIARRCPPRPGSRLAKIACWRWSGRSPWSSATCGGSSRT
jgi:hypothetical protein